MTITVDMLNLRSQNNLDKDKDSMAEKDKRASPRKGNATTQKLWWLALGGFAIVSLASPWEAHAEFDYKIHPGSLCQPSYGDETVNFIRGPGYIYHPNVRAEQPLSVTCPIIRDRVPHAGQTAELARLDVGVHFSRFLAIPELDQTVACTFYSLREDGSEVFVSPIQSTDPNQETQALFWDVSPEQTAIDGTYSIVCQMPAYVLLLRYIAGEDKSTDVGGF